MPALIKCPTCGVSVSATLVVCPYDGTTLRSPAKDGLDAEVPNEIWKEDEAVGERDPTARMTMSALALEQSGQVPTQMVDPEAIALAEGIGLDATLKRPRPEMLDSPHQDMPLPTQRIGEMDLDKTIQDQWRNVLPAPEPVAPPADRPTEGAGASQPNKRDPLLGQRLGEYVVKERIGLGGMGIVYRGEQPVIGKSVAIKVLRPDILDREVQMERLLAEARAVNAIRHRGIIDIFSFGQTPDGRHYFVMEFLEGTALDTLLKERGSLPLMDAIALSEEILAALSAAHQAGVIHRDLKPSNIFLVEQAAGSSYVKLLDFGLAKVGSPRGGAAMELSRVGMILGTPEYISPEQVRGEPVSAKSDLYSFGVIFFQMLTGKLPFTSSSGVGFLMKHLDDAPPDLAAHQPDLPKEVSDLVTALMAKDPAARPALEDVRAALRRLHRALSRDTLWPKAISRRPTSQAGSRGGDPRQAGPQDLTVPGRLAHSRSAGPAPHSPEPRMPGSGRWPLIVALAGGLFILALGVWLLASGKMQRVPRGGESLQGYETPAPGAGPVLPTTLPGSGEAVPARGTLTLITAPESEVFGGNQALGRTPLFNVPMPVGTHVVKLKGPDGVVHVLSVPIKPGRNTSYRLALDDVPAERP